MTELRFGYAAIVGMRGPIDMVPSGESSVEALTGPHLDYYYLQVTKEFAAISLNFLPVGIADNVTVEVAGRFQPYTRTADEAAMRAAIAQVLGDKVAIYRLKIG